ncbi:MAG: hypothetical protein QOF71_3637 [Candidatus Eremiobacteraeota bacterium]|jgi:hypothetical protein|nr:hypothetical protein [Candidatus Eremiobacteraeota bacterium]
MRNWAGFILTAVVLAAATPGVAPAADPAAPPMLTPSLARTVASACPAARPYADELVRGITRAQAAAATPILTKCAREVRLFVYQWKNDVANIALAATELSRGLLDRDPTLLRAAAYATRDLRGASRASDDQVRAWTIIPDYFDVARNELVFETQASCDVSAVANATYINVAARTGVAWITVPRGETLADRRLRTAACTLVSRDINGTLSPFSAAVGHYPDPGILNPNSSRDPAIEPILRELPVPR